MVHTREKPVAEAAGKSLFEVGLVLGVDPILDRLGDGVEGPAIRLRGGGDVVGGFQTALDFQAGNAEVGQVADEVVGAYAAATA